MSPRVARRCSEAALVAAAATLVACVWLTSLPARFSLRSLDHFFLFFPAYLSNGRALARGELPLWNPDLGLGIHEMADIQLGLSYPPNLIFAFVPTAVGIEILIWLHVALAAAGTFLLCRAAALTRASAAVAAVAVATGGASQGLAGWPAMLETFAWCPVAFYAARRLGEDPGPRPALALGAVLALQLLAGYLQLSLYTAACLPLFAWSGTRASARDVARSLPWLALGGLVGLGLAAFAVLPALAAVEGSVRSRAELPGGFYEAFPVDLGSYALGLVAPALEGHLAIYSGVLVPLLALGGLFGRGVAPGFRGAALLLSIMAVVFSLGSATPLLPLLWRLPIGHFFTNPDKAGYFFALGLAFLAAMGAEAMRRGMSPGARAGWLLLGGALLGAIPFSFSARIVGGLCLVALVSLSGGGRPREGIAVLLPVLVAATTLAGYDARALRPNDNLEYFERYREPYRALAERREAGRVFVLVPELAISPRQGEIEGVAQITSNGTFQPVRTDTYQRAVRRAVSEGKRERAVGLLRSAGARFVMTGRRQLAWLEEMGLTKIHAGAHADVWEDPGALPRAFYTRRFELRETDQVLDRLADPLVPATATVLLETGDGPVGVTDVAGGAEGRARIVSSTPWEVRVEVDAAAPGWLVLLDAWSPDWRATVDGRPARTRHANLVARAVELPAGAREVVFRFVPLPFYVGLAVTSLALVTCVAVLVATRRRHRRCAGDRILGKSSTEGFRPLRREGAASPGLIVSDFGDGLSFR